MRLIPFLSRSVAACAVAGALCLSASSQATPLTNTAWLVGSGESTTIHRGLTTQTVNTGGFKGDFGGNPIEFWCFDLDHTFSLGGGSLDYVATLLSGPDATQLSQLFQAGSLRASDADHSAGFQLAIWNIEYDSDLTINTGAFFVTSATAGAIAYANFLLGDLHNHDGLSPSITELDSTDRPHHQNFITPNTVPSECCRYVPEPPMLPLVLSAMGVAALVQSRRRTRVRGG